MKYFSLAISILLTTNAYAIDFDLKPGGEDIDGVKYYTLGAKNATEQKNIDVALDGNANTAKIRERFSFSCSWGGVEGVRIGMSSLTSDGGMTVDSYYFFDDKLNNVFSKSFSVINEKTPYIPLSLNHSACERNGGGVKKDSRTGKDYVENYEVIVDGPFALKEVPNVRVKYVSDKGLNLVKESEMGDVIVDSYKNKDNKSAVNKTLFFMNVSSERNIVSLISWGQSVNAHDNVCYKVYSYVYDDKGNISNNIALNNDPNLSGCEGSGNEFLYKNAGSIKNI